MSVTKETSQAVSVIGLGAMGSALAQLLLNDEYDVTVWNRTASKAEKLVKDGAIPVSNPVDAVKASPTVVICVYDYKASDSILKKDEISPVLADRTLIQLTSGSPKEAKNNEHWAHEHGAKYLDGAIQAAPTQMGQPDTPILISGAESVFHHNESIDYSGNTEQYQF